MAARNWLLSTGRGNGTSLAAATVRYIGIAGRLNFTLTSEAGVQTEVYNALTVSNLSVTVSANTMTAAATLRFRKNGLNGAQVVTVGAGLTGTFTDAVNSDALVAGDLVNMMATPAAAGSISATAIRCQVQHASADVPQQVTFHWPTVIGPAQTVYVAIGSTTFPDLENLRQVAVRHASTISKLQVNIPTNTTTITATTIRTRVNGANGAQSVTIGAGLTGRFEDGVNSDALVAGDLVNYQVVVGAAAGAVTVQIIAVDSTSAARILVLNDDTTDAAGNSGYTLLEGYGTTLSATEANEQATVPFACRLANHEILVSTNTLSGAYVNTVRVNEADSALVVTIGAGLTGRFTSQAVVNVNPGDKVSRRVAVDAGTGTIAAELQYLEQMQPAVPAPSGPGSRLLQLLAA